MICGPEGDQYRQGLSQNLPPHLHQAGEAYGLVAAALTGFAADLAGLQERMSPWRVRAPYLWQDAQAAHARVAAVAEVASGVSDFVKDHTAGLTRLSGALKTVSAITGAGRSISPNFIEDVIRTGTPSQSVVDGIARTIYRSGTVQVITEHGRQIVVTVLTK